MGHRSESRGPGVPESEVEAFLPFGLTFGIFVLLHRHAWRHRHALELTPVEEVVLLYGKRAHLLSAGLAVVSLLLIWLLPRQTAYAGMIYALMGPLHGGNGYLGGAAQARIKARQLGVSLSEDKPVA